MDSANNASSLPEWTRPEASFSERLGTGLLYTVPSGLFIFLQFSIIQVLFAQKEFRSHSCYLLMASISLVDIPQLAVHFYGGLIAIADDSFSQSFEKFAGGLATSLSIVDFALEAVLSLDRLLVFLPFRLLSAKNERILLGLLVFLSFLCGFPFFCLYLGPHSTIAFRHYAWDYLDIGCLEWDWVAKISESIPFPFLIGSMLAYLAIFGILFTQRQKMSTSSPQSANHQMLAPHERRLLLQAFAQFGVQCSLCSIWFWQMLDPVSTDGLAFGIFANFYWIFFCGFKPILYLAINRRIRERIFQLWRLHSAHQNVPSVQIAPAILLATQGNGILGHQKKASFSSIQSSSNGGSGSSGGRGLPFSQHHNSLHNSLHNSPIHSSLRSSAAAADKLGMAKANISTAPLRFTH